MSRAPLILVSPSIEKRGVEFHDRSVSLSFKYEQSILQAGGIPFIAPSTTDRALLADIVRRVDGVVLTGGDDINPGLYAKKLPRRRRARSARTGLARRDFPAAQAVAGDLPRASIAQYRARRGVDRGHPPAGSRRPQPSAHGPGGRNRSRSAVDSGFVARQDYRQAGFGREQFAPSGRAATGGAVAGRGVDEGRDRGSDGIKTRDSAADAVLVERAVPS